MEKQRAAAAEKARRGRVRAVAKDERRAKQAAAWEALTPAQRKQRTRLLLGVCAVVVIALIWSAIADDDDKTPASPGTSSSVSPAAALATLQYGADPSDSQIGSMQQRLTRLGSKCTQTGMDLADIAVTTQRVIRDNGRTISLVDVLDGIATSVPDRIAPTDCGQVASAFATIYLRG